MNEVRAERAPLAVVSNNGTPPRWKFVDDVAVLELPSSEWLVEGMIEKHSSVEVFGPPESMKSFFVLDLLMSVGAGTRFLNRTVVQGAAIYVCGEGIGGLPPRVAAWKRHHQISKRSGVHFLTTSVNLLAPEDVAGFITAARSIGTEFALVAFDTLARCIPGGDENRQQDMGIAVQSLDKIRECLPGRPATVVVHHTPRSGDTSRGSNSLDGAMETQILLKRDGDLLTVSCEKQKNAEHFATLTLRRELVEKSLVLVTDMSGSGKNEAFVSNSAHQILKSLHEAAMDDGLTTSTWLRVSGAEERTFYRVRKALVAHGYVIAGSKRGERNTITPEGAKAVTDMLT